LSSGRFFPGVLRSARFCPLFPSILILSRSRSPRCIRRRQDPAKVWQVGSSITDDVPDKHVFGGGDNLAARRKLVVASGKTAATGAPELSAASAPEASSPAASRRRQRRHRIHGAGRREGNIDFFFLMVILAKGLGTLIHNNELFLQVHLLSLTLHHETKPCPHLAACLEETVDARMEEATC
ncbi:unnamed protein product, partial [Urochloa humidicola]